MNVDGGMGNVEIIGNIFFLLDLFDKIIFQCQFVWFLWASDNQLELKFAEIIPEKNRAGLQ